MICSTPFSSNLTSAFCTSFAIRPCKFFCAVLPIIDAVADWSCAAPRPRAPSGRSAAPVAAFVNGSTKTTKSVRSRCTKQCSVIRIRSSARWRGDDVVTLDSMRSFACSASEIIEERCALFASPRRSAVAGAVRLICVSRRYACVSRRMSRQFIERSRLCVCSESRASVSIRVIPPFGPGIVQEGGETCRASIVKDVRGSESNCEHDSRGM